MGSLGVRRLGGQHRRLRRGRRDPHGRSDLPRDPGGWDHEARTGQGRIVSSVVPLLHFGANYQVKVPPETIQKEQKILDFLVEERDTHEPG